MDTGKLTAASDGAGDDHQLLTAAVGAAPNVAVEGEVADERVVVVLGAIAGAVDVVLRPPGPEVSPLIRQLAQAWPAPRSTEPARFITPLQTSSTGRSANLGVSSGRLSMTPAAADAGYMAFAPITGADNTASHHRAEGVTQ
jgi:hypothetical protein